MEGFVSNPALQIAILQQSARTAAFGEPGDGVSDPADLSKSRTDGSLALFQLICAVRSIGGFGLGAAILCALRKCLHWAESQQSRSLCSQTMFSQNFANTVFATQH